MTRSAPLPGDVAEALAETVGIPDASRLTVTPLSGGCIHPAARIELEPGRAIFAKWSDRPGTSGFGVEARGLEALRKADGPRVPDVLGFGEGSADERGWLALEFIDPGRASEQTAASLGSELAQLHRPSPAANAGWSEDGYIGPLPQANRSNGIQWHSFWAEARLEPQWRAVEDRFPGTVQDAWAQMFDALPSALNGAPVGGMSLLHGDLWSGNVLTDEIGAPVLIDPAVYTGDREVDLAMMELFGGFAPAVFDAYDDALPIDVGYARVRRDIYQLYPLLVHVRLFGSNYIPDVVIRVQRILSVV